MTIGDTISHYEILEKLGSGGMGVVYKARDLKLDRLVAIKFLPPEVERSGEEKARFIHEAKAASALEHKNICSIHEIDESEDGQTFIVMAYYEGESLLDRMKGGPLPVDESLEITLQVAEGLAAAHAKNIVHRDVKPANVMLAADGQAKLVDFGLAKLEGQTKLTKAGSTLGTISYMAPEQARGHDVDGRADVFSVGAVLYEMLPGRPPFMGGHEVAVLEQLLNQDADPVSAHRRDVPPQLDGLVAACLSKDPNRRLTAEALAERLREARRTTLSGRAELSGARLLRRSFVVVPSVLALVALGLWGYRSQQQRADETWARAEAVPRIAELLGEIRYAEALTLAQEAQRIIPDDPMLAELIEGATVEVDVTTDPPGAEVFYRPYLDSEAPWVSVGVSPIEGVRMPWGHVRIRAVKEGYETHEGSGTGSFGFLRIALTPSGEAPPGMVRVSAGIYPQLDGSPVEVDAFWIDRFEVTNAQYQAFVDQGGYEDPTHWDEVMKAEEGQWEAIVGGLYDATGRAGPASWEVGRFPEGRGDHPVSGVSWYEAAAYCAFAGKRLPTLFHWWVASSGTFDVWAETAVASNFEGSGLAAVGSFAGIGVNGTYDMAGNVAEWVSTEATGSARYVLGGSWRDPGYVYMNLVARDPLDRAPDLGFRCAEFDVPLDDPTLQPVEEAKYDFRGVEPVDDLTFQQWLRFYEYDPLPLEAAVESSLVWREGIQKETVTFSSAYGEEIVAYLFLPTDVEPPYQTVVYSPGSTAYSLPSSKTLPEMGAFRFILRSGRAFIYPVYKGSYERQFALPSRGPVERRQRVVWRQQDVNRTVDYLESREDIDADRLAYLGLSAGAEYGALSVAVEPRFKAAVWIGGGYDPTHMQRELPIQVPWNYAPHVTTPVLMVNGRGDSAMPVETAQRPLFDDLGTAPADKRHVVLDGGHLPRGAEMVREILDWLDTYLGPVGGA
jgi:tRNA A-37 threonylcarbamoyl transferase component Bud32/predicted esterase